MRYSFLRMPNAFTLDVVMTNDQRTSLEVPDPATLTVYDVKSAMYAASGNVPAEAMTLTDHNGTVLQDSQTVDSVHLDALNHRVTLDAPALRAQVTGASVSTTATFIGYLVLSLVLLILFFVFISFSESAYDAVERTYTRLSQRQWREGRPSVLVELLIFFAVLLFFGIMMWQLAAHGSSSDAANTYGSSPVYPNPDDPLRPEHIDVPKERKKKMTTKERVLAIVGTVVLVLLIALVAYALRSKWVQGKIQELRDHTSNRRNREMATKPRRDNGPASASDYDNDWRIS